MLVSKHTAERRGVVLVAVMACSLVVLLIGAVLLRLALAERQQLRVAERRLQASWLVESGVERAAAKLAANADYAGETWEIPAAELGGQTRGVASIVVEPLAGQPHRRLVRVRADYPTEPQQRVRRSKQVLIDVGNDE